MDSVDAVTRALDAFVEQAKCVFAERLVSIVLYGSAAEGKLRHTSDVNLVLVARTYTPNDAAELSGVVALTSAAVGLQVMFLLDSEVKTASQLFAVKFSDISRRRRVLHGDDPFATLDISREALLERMRQVLLNHLLRLRYVFALRNDSTQQLSQIVADSISPLRAAAAGLLELRGTGFENVKQALGIVARELRADGFEQTLALVSEMREGKQHSLVEVRKALGDILEITTRLKELVKSLAL